MKFLKTSNLYSLNKSTYVYLRWIAYIGQIIAIIIVQFLFEYKFNYLVCISIIFFSVLTNLYLQFKIKENQLNNFTSTMYLSYDIFQLGILLFFTGGVTNPFIFLILVPAVFSSQYLHFLSSVILVTFITIILIFLTFYYYDLPHPGELHFHAPDYYFYTIPISVIIGLIFLVYFGVKFGEESRIRKKAYDKIQELMAKENELLSLGGQAAAAAHSLGTPLSTILLIAKELQKEFGNNHKMKNDLNLLVSQSNRCREILKKLSLNPNIEDEFIDSNFSLNDYVNKIVRSYQEISNKEFVINLEHHKNPININKSTEIIYGLRNFIGNANKFSKKKIEIFLNSNKKATKITIRDDGPGFPKDLIDKHILGEPYIRTIDQGNISKYGLGLGTFIGKTLLEKNFANINFKNSPETGGAEIVIKWENGDLRKV
ncbi:MAG TPA: ActS/PrrB/RegB family redox-sensitive histidine kinase [Candidatus Pelagibacter bacterium]|jgi:two-component system sensor histidine kinase RegB|nr:ActS/PrrB/RegB family redox-sensitive histidine kinase [Candidatus Pelagibacter bacterium]|tara:strand:+ start:5773 stop:7059 length:1287 start_codon:yes stop_codon:yes gene_type:complete